jgi:hypothetical protein
MQEKLLVESRIDWIKDNTKSISTEHDPQAISTDKNTIVDHIADTADPTKKKLYTHWLVKRYNAGDFKQEDAYKVADHISNFDKHKSKLDKKDINQYGSLDELKSAVAPHEGTAATKKEALVQAKSNLNMPGHELKYDDDNISIYHIKDKETSQKIYGRKNDKNPGICPTDWCTATQDNKHNRFDYYTKEEHPGSKLHVVHRKSDGAVFQYHPESNQFMDKHDEPISNEDFKSISPSLHKAWKEDPSLL